jgi:ribulose-bisphosphate carboxylase large chain
MRDQRVVRCTYYLESDIEPSRAAAILAGEQSSGTFVSVPGESPELHERHSAQIVDLQHLGRRLPSLPSRTQPDKVHAARVVIEWPMENIGTDLATLQTTIAGNLFELQELFACRVVDLQLPADFIAAHAGPAFGIAGTRHLISDITSVMVGTIVKPNVGLSEEQFRSVVRELSRASIDLIKDDELMTDPGYFFLHRRVAVATEEIHAAEQVTGHRTMYAFNITGDLAGLRRRHDLVVEAGGRCVMLNVPVMGIPALAWLREFAEVPIHGHRAGLAGSMRSPALGMSYQVWQQLARLAGADHLHVSGLGSKFYETDEEVADNVRSLLQPLGDTLGPVPTLSSGQNVTTAAPTYAAVRSSDLLMLAGGGVAAHPDGPAAGVVSLRQAWSAAIDGVPLQRAAEAAARTGEPALLNAVRRFGHQASEG